MQTTLPDWVLYELGVGLDPQPVDDEPPADEAADMGTVVPFEPTP